MRLSKSDREQLAVIRAELGPSLTVRVVMGGKHKRAVWDGGQALLNNAPGDPRVLKNLRAQIRKKLL